MTFEDLTMCDLKKMWKCILKQRILLYRSIKVILHLKFTIFANFGKYTKRVHACTVLHNIRMILKQKFVRNLA